MPRALLVLAGVRCFLSEVLIQGALGGDSAVGCLLERILNRETCILLSNNQRQHCALHAPKDVLPSRTCAHYWAPWQRQRTSPARLFSRAFQLQDSWHTLGYLKPHKIYLVQCYLADKKPQHPRTLP